MHADEIPKLPEELYRLDNWHGPLEWATDVLLVAASIALALRWPLLYPLAVLVIGARQRALASLLHSATHLSLARSRRLNHLLGTWGCAYLVFQTWAAYFGSHIRLHHGRFGHADDPDYAFQREIGLYAPFTLQDVWRGFRLYTRYLVVNRLRPPPGSRGELLRIGLLWAAIVAVCGPLNVLLFWLLPMLLAHGPIGYLVETAEHWPLMPARHPLYQTRNRASSWMEAWLFSTHHENYHLVHHLYPRLPNHAMKAADRHLRSTWPAYRAWADQNGGILLSANCAPTLLQLLRRAARRPVAA